MKATEYAAKVLKANTGEEYTSAVVEVTKEFLEEMHQLIEKRKVLLNRGVIPIIKEQDQKYRKFACLINEVLPEGYGKVKPSGFMEVLAKLHPGVYHFYTNQAYYNTLIPNIL